jgi:hypothetical protein
MDDFYELTWRNKFLTSDAGSIDDMIDSLLSAVVELAAMRDRGVFLIPSSDIGGDHAVLTTNDPCVAEDFGFELADEVEGLQDDDYALDPDAVELEA